MWRHVTAIGFILHPALRIPGYQKFYFVIMAGKAKKKSSSKKNQVQNPPRYVVAPASPVVTRSTDKKSSKKDVTTPPAQSPPSDTSSAPSAPSVSSLVDLEKKFDNRFSQMETSFRSALSEVSMGAAARPLAAEAVDPAVIDPQPAITVAVPDKGRGRHRHGSSCSGRSASPRHRHHHRRHRSSRHSRNNRRDPSVSSRSSSSSSSSSSDASRSSSSSSDFSSDRHRHSHRRRRSRRSSKDKKSKYDTSKYLREGKKLTTYERLVLANAKMALALYKKKRDIRGFLEHVILVAEKADGPLFAAEALIQYDESVKQTAKEHGLKSFRKIDPANIVKHLSYDGTQVAMNAKRGIQSSKKAPAPASNQKSAGASHDFSCLKHNFTLGGCRAPSCRFKHICPACASLNHVNADCPNIDRSGGSAKRKWSHAVGGATAVDTLQAQVPSHPDTIYSYGNHSHTLHADDRSADLITSESGNQVTQVAMENAVTPRDFREAILDQVSPDERLHTVSPDLFILTPQLGESPNYPDSSHMLFETPSYPGITSIPIYNACSSGKCSCIHLIGGLPSQLKPCRAAPFLFGPSPLDTISSDDNVFLWRGLMKGFDIVDDHCQSSYFCENYDSILDDKFYTEMSELLTTELDQSKVSEVDYKPRCVHSLGAVLKSNGKLRPITDCSRPEGISINNFMETTFKAFSYNSVEDAVDILAPDDFMAVVDISSAYRSVNVNPDQVDFQGFTWDFGKGPKMMVDRRLCFGLRCAPNIFNSLSSFIVKIAHARGARHVINYLDDFLIIAPSSEKCRVDRDIVVDTIRLLGFEVSWKKVTDPSPVTTFLGITIDSQKMELSLPLAKVEKLKALITETLSCGYASKKRLECLGGLMSHCSYVVRGGRTFSRRLFDLAASYSRHAQRIPLTHSVQADLDWWLAFCLIFNGRACIVKDLHPVPIVSDSSFMGYWVTWVKTFHANPPRTPTR